MIRTETIYFTIIYLEYDCLLSLICWASTGSCALIRTFGKRCTHVLCRENVVSLTAVSSDRWFHRTKDPGAHIFSVLLLGKVILRDSKTNSFPNISYGHNEEVVEVTVCFVTPETHSGKSGGDPFLQPGHCVFDDWADCIPVLLAGIKDMPICFQHNLANASILSYDRWYLPAKALFSEPIGLLLTIFHLKKFRSTFHY